MTEETWGGTSVNTLAEAIIALNSELDLDGVLNRFLEVSVEQTGARYAALNMLDDERKSKKFYYVGMDNSLWARIGHGPGAVGVLNAIPDVGVLVVDEVVAHPAFEGFPEGHPPLGSFLGTALRVRGIVFGYLYLASKEGGFTDHDESVVLALAAAASVAIDNSTMYEQAVERERWLSASQEITTSLLADPGEERRLQQIIDEALGLAYAEAAALALPGLHNAWTLEFAAGDDADELLGLALPEDGQAMETVRSGKGRIAEVPPGNAVLEPVQKFGPSLYAPLRAEGRTIGLLMLWRKRGGQLFDDHSLDVSQRFANQAALAVTVAEVSHARGMSALLDERRRIADDLHDLVSQELFAAAIQLDLLADEDTAFADRIEAAHEHITRAQQEVRGVMSNLAKQRAAEPLSDRVRREVVLAGHALGYQADVEADWSAIPAAVEGDFGLADDVVAVVRESLSNVARHAQATQAMVELRVDDTHLIVKVLDDGIGPPKRFSRQSGTANLAGRALRRGGSFSMDPQYPGRDKPGTVMTWSVHWR